MDGDTNLFRQEAIDSRKSKWFGRPQLLRPITATVATWCAVVSVLLIGLFVTFGEYTRRVRLTGTVQTDVGVMRLVAPQIGRIIQTSAHEGQRVKRGDRLYALSTDSTTSEGDTYLAIVTQLRVQRKELDQEIDRRTELDKEQKNNLQEQAEGLNQEAAQVATQIAITEAYVETLKQFAERLESVVEKGIIAQREFEVRRESYMAQRSVLENLRRDSIQLKAKLQDVHSKLKSFDAEANSVVGGIRRQISVVDQQIADMEDNREVLITAPQDGTVTAVLVQPGQSVAVGTPLLSILPASGQLEVHFFASSSAIGFVRKGSHVLLRYAPFPYQKFGQYPGTVTEISRVALRPTDNENIVPGQVPGGASASGFYRVAVRPEQNTVLAYGEREPLQVGMDVEADVFLDTRKLYEWILEPLYSLKGSISGASKSSMVVEPDA